MHLQTQKQLQQDGARSGTTVTPTPSWNERVLKTVFTSPCLISVLQHFLECTDASWLIYINIMLSAAQLQFTDVLNHNITGLTGFNWIKSLTLSSLNCCWHCYSGSLDNSCFVLNIWTSSGLLPMVFATALPPPVCVIYHKRLLHCRIVTPMKVARP